MGLEWSLMGAVICVFDTATGLNLIKADDLERNWPNNICQCNMPEIQSEFDKKY